MPLIKRFAACVGFALLLSTLSATPAQTSRYLHTSGSQIMNSANQPVRLAGVNWYGFETSDENIHGLWAQDYKTILNQVRSLGYNTVRIPFSNQMIETPIQPGDIDYNNSSGPINSDLAGLNSLRILDRIIAYAGQIGLYVILDDHRSEAGTSAESNGLWYTAQYPESAWLQDWIDLANHYKNSPAVIGMDLRNEPHAVGTGGACWGCGTPTEDWRLAAERAGNAILNVNPNLLIFVEGVSCHGGDCTWWGSNLSGAAAYPVVLNVPNRLVYSAHEYGPSLDQQDWFNTSTTYASLTALWTRRWAYLSLNGVAPVWLGEFGTTNNADDIVNITPGSQGQYFSSMIEFLSTNSNIHWTYWGLNGEDKYNLLDSSYATPASAAKQNALASIQRGIGGTAPVCKTVASPPLGLSATATSASQINLAWSADASPAGCSVTYNVYASKTANFIPATTNLSKSGVTAPSYSATGLTDSTVYYFAVEALDAVGSSSASPDVSASTQSGAKAVPSSPSNLTASAASASAVQLAWHASATTGVTYNVYRSPTSGFSVAQGTLVASGITATSYTNTGLAASTSYFYLVTTVDAGGESTPSNQAPATTQPGTTPAGTACRVLYTIQTQWNNGFQSGITLENTGSAPFANWTLTWTWPSGQTITQAWSSNLVQPGPAVSLTNASWNGTIAPGSSATGIGFLASYTGTNTAPTAFHVNGVLCR